MGYCNIPEKIRQYIGEVLKLFYEEGQVEFKDFKQLTEKTKSIIARI